MKLGRRTAALETIKRLEKVHSDAKIALSFSNPLELLVATILSAQCTDKRVNIVTKSLFKKYRTAQDYAKADLKTLEEEIKSTGFYHNKAKNIKKSCQMLVEEFNGQVPKSMEELLQLPGVARKTANIVLANAYGIVEGIAVDTHVRRLAKRLGLTDNDNPDKIEKDLMEIVPKKSWARITDLLIFHGRKICTAKHPNCAGCMLNDFCPSAFTFD
ncbi:MAG TPA: endonuclease III [Candidatus Krumholzibacteriaceae bacterium]|nr:endonuclease III [Candidatus Krumholzibacteriaceae bacterium]